MGENYIWMELLEYAKWSPSPHNIQPWKIKILSPEEADLYYVPQRLLPVEDVTGCFTILGFGVFIENLSIAASIYGLEVEEIYDNVLLDSNKKEPTFFAKLKLKKTNQKEELDRELIKQRRTSRLPYNESQVNEEVLKELKKVAKAYQQNFDFSSDEALVDWILQLNCATLFDDMNDVDTRNEVGKWLRYSAVEANTKRDGLWAYCLNVPASFLYLAFKQRWVVNLPLLNNYIKSRYLETTRGTKTVAWLYGPFNKPSDWIKAGHMLARLWLTLTKRGVYLHPFGSIITNKKSHAKVIEKFKVDEEKNPLWLLVRMGHSDTPPRSIRLSIEDIILNEG